MSSKSLKIIKFLNTDKAFEADDQLSVLDLAIQESVDLDHSCEGMGTCGTCRVIVKKGLENLPEPNEVEQDIREARSFLPEERLACQTMCVADLDLEIPED